MVAVRTALAGSLAALGLLLVALSTAVGLSPPAWGVGAASGVMVAGAVARGLARAGGRVLGPADLVTLGRATIACAVAALVAESVLGQPLTVPVVALATVALVLDSVDGRVARATRTQSAFGGRFDGEADAFLLLVLSVPVAQSHGWWAIAIGVARYAFLAAGWVFPWLRAPLPRRDWRKVVTAVQGIVLVVAASGVLPTVPTTAALLLALALLVESFGRDGVWLARRRRAAPAPAPAGVRRLPVP